MRRIIERLTMHQAATVEDCVERARGWSSALEDREAAKRGGTVREARPVVAQRLGIAPGTLENLRNGRMKAVAVHVYERLRAAILGELQAELRRLEHETHVLMASGVDPRDDEAQAVVADLATVRAALGLKTGEPE